MKFLAMIGVVWAAAMLTGCSTASCDGSVASADTAGTDTRSRLERENVCRAKWRPWVTFVGQGPMPDDAGYTWKLPSLFRSKAEGAGRAEP
jgi:hypothetical protein